MAARDEVAALGIHLQATNEKLSPDVELGGDLLDETSLGDGVVGNLLLVLFTTIASSNDDWGNGVGLFDEEIYSEHRKAQGIDLDGFPFDVNVEFAQLD